MQILINPGGIALRRWCEHDTEFMTRRGFLQWQPVQLALVGYKGEHYLQNITPKVTSRHGEYLSYNFMRDLTLDTWLSSVSWKLIDDMLCVHQFMFRNWTAGVDLTVGWEERRASYRVGDPSPRYREVVPLKFPYEANKALHEALRTPL